MSLGVLKNLFAQRQHGRAETAETAVVSPDVSAKPAPVLGCTPETAETSESDVSSKQVATAAANDPEPVDGLADWNVAGLGGASAATVTLFRAASRALDRQIVAAGAHAAPDRDCWPYSSAMNPREIDTFTARAELFRRRGISADIAETLADKLVRRDREGDDRALCLECSHYSRGRCAAWKAAGLISGDVGGFASKLQRCPAFRGEGQP